MACLSEKVALGAAYASLIATGVVVVAGAETVILTVAGAAAFFAAAAAYIAALIALSSCLDNANRPDDAAKLRKQAADMQRDIDALKKRLGM
jgi:hypothetical protein